MISHLMFDLDNTLYPESGAMDAGVTQRMIQAVASYLHISINEAKVLRHSRRHLFSTTLEWLMKDYGFTDLDWFFEVVHPNSEVNELSPDKNLRPFLVSLNMPMSVLTNAPMLHATRVLHFFGIEDLFIHISDIFENSFIGKPNESAYLRACTAAGFSIQETLFLDDQIQYVKGYEAIGGKAVLIDETDKYAKESCIRIHSIYELPKLLQSFKE